MLKCTRCERNLKSGSKFCSACGAKVKPALKCVKCGTEYENGDKFCCECGSVVGIEASLFGEFIDGRDGRRYRTVRLDSKIWLAENLSYGGKGGYIGKSCDNDYCRVYNWADAKEAYPEGWHLPSFREWHELLNVRKNDHWWSAEHSSYSNGFFSNFSNNSHKLCLLEVRCVRD